jgi:hypothetical protein
MSDGNVKLLMFSDIEGCQADSKYPQSTFLCSKPFYDKLVNMLDSDTNLHIAFLGDYFDQGMRVHESIKGMLNLLEKYSDRVHAILGNRDVNKLRFCFELLHRANIKESLSKMTSVDINTLEPTEETKDDKIVKKCPVFDKGWKAWSPYYFGIHKNEIIEAPNYIVKGEIAEADDDVSLVKHILMSSMGAGKSENEKMTGLYSFMPFEKIDDAQDATAVKYLKVALGIEPRGDAQDALDLLDFFSKCKLAHVFNGTFGKVLLAHGGGFDSDAFFDKAYVYSFGVGMPDEIAPKDYHTTLEEFRRQLSGLEPSVKAPSVKIGGATEGLTPQQMLDRRNMYGKKVNKENLKGIDRTNATVEPSVNVYNELLQDVIGEIRKKRFTWKFVLLQALGLKPDSEDARYKSLIQSCGQDGCKGPNDPLTTDKDGAQLAKILNNSGITHVSYGHKPICFPNPVIYRRKGTEKGKEIERITFISNDTSNGNRKIDEVGNSTAIGTMVIFDPNGVQSLIKPIELGAREGKVGLYEAMYAPLTLDTTPFYEEENGANFLRYGNKKVVFNIKGFDQLKFEDIPSPATERAQETAAAPAASGGRRRSRNRKRNTKRVSRYISKRTRRNKQTRRGRKIRKY